MAPTKDEIRALVLNRLKEAGFEGEEELSVPDSKDAYRAVHSLARQHEIDKRSHRIEKAWQRHQEKFAHPSEIDPAQIDPSLDIIERGDSRKNELWRLARFYWSLPYSGGYGRRIRFLIWDAHVEKLLGIGGLQSPPLDFRPRDELLEYPEGEKPFFVNQTMDAFTVGAVPPYSTLLGGKLAAMALGATELREEYSRRYEGKETEMKGRVLPANLVAVTTTSAFGKSAMYDRVRDSKGETIVRSIGMMEETHGSYHFNGIYPKLKEFVKTQEGIDQEHGFGTGPRIRWQVIRKALRLANLSRDLLKHNVPREAFLVPHIHNLRSYVETGEGPDWISRNFEDLAAHWKQRWCLPRFQRFEEIPRLEEEFFSWEPEDLIRDILGDGWQDDG